MLQQSSSSKIMVAKDLLSSLGREHLLIVAVLGAFEAYLDDMSNVADPTRQELTRFMTFLSDYADGWHHAREEEVLLPAMVRHGYAKSSGVLVHIREQHKRERGLFFQLKRAVADKHPWSAHQLDTVLRVSRELISFERTHIQKETDLFYPAAAKELTADDPAFVETDLLWFHETHAPPEYMTWLEQLGAELIKDHPRA